MGPSEGGEGRCLGVGVVCCDLQRQREMRVCVARGSNNINFIIYIISLFQIYDPADSSLGSSQPCIYLVSL